jgi:hypothetical protein
MVLIISGMKRLLLLAVLPLLLFTCTSTSLSTGMSRSESAKQQNADISSEPVISFPIISETPHENSAHNYSSLSENDVGKNITLTGLLEFSDGEYRLITNPKSRSRVTFMLLFDAPNEPVLNAAQKNQIHLYAGQTVTVTGILTKADSPWTKELAVIIFKK